MPIVGCSLDHTQVSGSRGAVQATLTVTDIHLDGEACNTRCPAHAQRSVEISTCAVPTRHIDPRLRKGFDDAQTDTAGTTSYDRNSILLQELRHFSSIFPGA
jgi:hypothetical protein